MENVFTSMPADARVWVYASSRKLSAAETTAIKAKADAFVTGWTAHQLQLRASFDILFDTFLVFMVDENVNAVSGCGIDKSVNFVKELEQETGITFFNRLQIEYLAENGELVTGNKQSVIEAYNNGNINDDTRFINKNVLTKAAFDSSFIIPFKQSWVYQQVSSGQPAGGL